MTPTMRAALEAASPATIVLIWSGEHRAWWKPEAQGYTTDRDQAGRYWLNDAQKLTAHCGPEKRIKFHRAARPEGEVIVAAVEAAAKEVGDGTWFDRASVRHAVHVALKETGHE